MDLGGDRRVVARAAGTPHAEALAAEGVGQLQDAPFGAHGGDDAAASDHLHRLIAHRLPPSDSDRVAQASPRGAVDDEQVRQVDGAIALRCRRLRDGQHQDRHRRRAEPQDPRRPASEDHEVGALARAAAAPEVTQHLRSAGQFGRGANALGGERRGQVDRRPRGGHQEPAVELGVACSRRKAPTACRARGLSASQSSSRNGRGDDGSFGRRPRRVQRPPPPDLGHGTGHGGHGLGRRREHHQLDLGSGDALLEVDRPDALDELDPHLLRCRGGGLAERRHLLVRGVDGGLLSLRPRPGRRSGRQSGHQEGDPEQLAVRRHAPQGREGGVRRGTGGRDEQDAAEAHDVRVSAPDAVPELGDAPGRPQRGQVVVRRVLGHGVGQPLTPFGAGEEAEQRRAAPRADWRAGPPASPAVATRRPRSGTPAEMGQAAQGAGGRAGMGSRAMTCR